MKLNGLVSLLTTLIGSFIFLIPTTQAQQSIPTAALHSEPALVKNNITNPENLNDIDGLNQNMPHANPGSNSGEQNAIPMQHDIDMDNDDDDDDDDDVPDNEDSLGSAPSV